MLNYAPRHNIDLIAIKSVYTEQNVCKIMKMNINVGKTFTTIFRFRILSAAYDHSAHITIKAGKERERENVMRERGNKSKERKELKNQ